MADADKPTLAGKLLALQQAGIDQGKAIARCDTVSATAAHKRAYLLIDEILEMTGEADLMPRLNRVAE